MSLMSLMSHTSLTSLRKLALVLAGGFCGTLARYYLAAPLLTLAALLLPGAQSGFPYDTFAINLSGAFALGLLYGLAERGARISPDVRLALGTGFLGAYTTFSTFTVGGDKLLLDGAWLIGTLYLAGSIVLGVFCAHLGHIAAGAIVARQRISRGVRVRARRAWRLAVAPYTHASRTHASRVQPWRLTPRGRTRSGHASHASHSGAHAVPRAVEHVSRLDLSGDEYTEHAHRQAEEVR